MDLKRKKGNMKNNSVYLKQKKTDTTRPEIDTNRYTNYNGDMNRILYHGSDNIIKEPVYGMGNPLNDYGLGFYCTTIESLAREWGARRKGNGYVNIYSLRDDRYQVLDLTKPPFNNVLYWVALLMHNRNISATLKRDYPRELEYLERNYLIDVSKYDVVIGYRADDSYFHFPEAFVKSEITIASLEKIFAAGELGKQYVLISQRAIKNLTFVRYYPVSNEYREDYFSRKNKADKSFADLLIKDRYSKEKRLRDLIDEE